MNEVDNITEEKIKVALQKGLITPLEARQMLLVYLQKKRFSSMENHRLK